MAIKPGPFNYELRCPALVGCCITLRLGTVREWSSRDQRSLVRGIPGSL